MKAQDIMTSEIVSVGPNATVQATAALMAEQRISGLPVLSEKGEVLGIVSEADLLRRVELGTAEEASRWTRVFSDPDKLAREFARSHGLKAHEVMSRPVVSVQADADVKDVADTLGHYRIKRVPVMKDGKIVGMITRSDLVAAFSRLQASSEATAPGSAAIHAAIMAKMKAQPWLDASYMNIRVKDGVVDISGYVQTEDQRTAVLVLIEEVEGVVRTDDGLQLGVPELLWEGVR